MKIPMRYQMTEYDCGPTSLMNAIQFLFEGDEIPPDFPKMIWSITLDGYNDNGIAYRTGTTSEAMRFFGSWLNGFAKMTRYPVKTDFLEKDEVHITADSRIVQELKSGAAVVTRCLFDVGHYITLTGMEGDYVKVFDPYWMEKKIKIDGLIYVDDHPKEYNRLIHKDILESETGVIYALNDVEKRDALIIRRTGLQIKKYKSFL